MEQDVLYWHSINEALNERRESVLKMLSYIRIYILLNISGQNYREFQEIEVYKSHP